MRILHVEFCGIVGLVVCCSCFFAAPFSSTHTGSLSTIEEIENKFRLFLAELAVQSSHRGIGPEFEQIKREPPHGFSAVRGKRNRQVPNSLTSQFEDDILASNDKRGAAPPGMFVAVRGKRATAANDDANDTPEPLNDEMVNVELLKTAVPQMEEDSKPEHPTLDNTVFAKLLEKFLEKYSSVNIEDETREIVENGAQGQNSNEEVDPDFEDETSDKRNLQLNPGHFIPVRG